MKQIQVSGVNLEYVDEGMGIPVIFSHGGHSDLRYWEPQREAFANRYRFVAYSHRGQGSDVWPSEADYSAEAHVDDLLAIIGRLKAGPVHLVGFSTAITLRATLRDPEFVRSLTVIEPNVPWLLEGDPEGKSVMAWWRDEKKRVEVEAAGDGEHTARLWFELVNNQGPHTFDTQPESLRQMWLHNFGRRRSTAAPAEPLTCEKLRAIKTPTLAIEAEYGMPYSRRIIKKLAECIPGCRLATVPGVTHFMSYQEPAAFNRVVLDFLAEHE